MCAKKKQNKSNTTTNESIPKSEVKTDISSIPPEQITKLRDAFDIIDHDTDGIITEDDLKQLKQTIAKELSDEEINNLLGNKDEEMNFSKFLSIISQDLKDVPNKNEILKALQVFSTDSEINSKELGDNLSAIGMKQTDFEPILNKFKSETMNGETIFMGTNFLNFVSS
ncbi:Calmodulin-related protein [Wickerhamomyces ciferrii]|uniref:Calmodulin-related protein n=1 Tax=Wickerhamomyces ciferrii (strain ATCC 14091 / BCRC 22168 / CBS 111 / JCM 3599 / NBRC 0793 / NRRL Y-1031 F-60-10) TaxID=1206466 RepID=K0KVI5_WICCF|nr:Calmodulin-related protein [Wickerhamomyces ciferrii]CCH45474.1 Calmodulin-related protein [Wickerhamomyces ciferrii]